MSIVSMTEQKQSTTPPPRPIESTDATKPSRHTLVELAEQLGKVRDAAEFTEDRMLLYLIDMAIFHVCDSVCVVSRPGIADDLERRRVEAIQARARRSGR